MLLRSGLLQSHKDDKSEKGLSRAENLKELISATTEFVIPPDMNTISEIEAFLSEVVLETGEEHAEQTDSVSLMTLHAAKGLEFPVVFIVGMEEQLFPHQMSIADRNGLEEERRLCYVGMTRAMKKLFLSCAEYRQLYGKGQYNAPSRFIAEIPETLLHRIRPKLTVSKANTAYGADNSTYFAKSRSKENTVKSNHHDSGFKISQRVSHAKFGEGYILDIEGAGESARVQVRFEKHGAKWLILSFAGLTPA
jgi:DNA helicase-2/ATP-dependent DNA helicase PcrA